jgi:hypothetical protein
MHDPVYRSGVAAEQTAYNQPPHVGFYMGEDAFEPDAVSIEITSLPNKTTYSIGENLDTTGLTVTATLEDGTQNDVTAFTVSGYDAEKTGKQTVTVTYKGKTATFTVTVTPASIESINNEYTTDSSSTSEIQIGCYSDAFTLEHTVTINSMPANGSSEKNSTAGFFMRFSPTDGTGAGWYLTANGTNKANVMWKSTSPSQITSTPLNVGETYNFKYEFTNVGDGTGASVSLTITDMSGNIVGSGTNLNLRNLSNDKQKVSSLGVVQIYNQAKTNSTASVTIDDAKIYGSGSITANGSSVTVTTSTLSKTKVYAAKYNNGILENISDITPTATGTQTVTAEFEPDRIFMWTEDMFPIASWSKEN